MKEHYPLSKLSTFGIGGNARYLIEVRTLEEMRSALAESKRLSLPFFIIGKGSNSLFDDEGLNALVILNKMDQIEQPIPGTYRVGAGYNFSRLGSLTAREGWKGLEFAAGIPASVGGAVWMNAGANKQETKDTLQEVVFMNENGEIATYKKEEMSFSYRHSPFQSMKGVILEATFILEPCTEAREKQIEIIDYRKGTQPYGDKSAGCIFRNPTGNHAGKLIEEAGLKGFSIGGAQVSTQHANFIVNSENAKAKDVLKLIETVQRKIKEKFNIELQPEVRYISNEKVQQ